MLKESAIQFGHLTSAQFDQWVISTKGTGVDIFLQVCRFAGLQVGRLAALRQAHITCRKMTATADTGTFTMLHSETADY